MQTKISSKNIVKIFGDDPHEALRLLDAGHSKEEIFERTGQTVGVDGASFDVAAGEIFVVMGLSGSGKSTLVRMINGLIKPTSGEMMIDGVDVANCSDQQLRKVRRDKVAMVFQHFALLPHKTVAENAAFGLKIKGIGAEERRAKALEALDQVGLAAWADSYPDELSGGMQQRVGLARGLASDPEILLMDEPFSALDPLIRSDMQQELLELQRSLKKTIVFITHDLNEALALGNAIAIMRNGRIVQTGTAEEIVASPADDYVAAFTREIDRSRVFTAASVADAPASVEADAGLEGAVAEMDTLGLDAIHVTEEGRPLGVVTYRAANAAMGNGEDLGEVMSEDFPQSPPETLLVDLFPLTGEGLPVALTDEEGKLVGVVQPHAVMQQLSETGEQK